MKHLTAQLKFWKDWFFGKFLKKEKAPQSIPYLKMAFFFGLFNALSLVFAVVAVSGFFLILEKMTTKGSGQTTASTESTDIHYPSPSPSPSPYNSYSDANLRIYLHVEGKTLPEAKQALENKREKVKEILSKYVGIKDFKMGSFNIYTSERDISDRFYGSSDVAVYFKPEEMEAIDFAKLSKELKAIGANFSSLYSP